jgi:hypothetical protein
MKQLRSVSPSYFSFAQIELYNSLREDSATENVNEAYIAAKRSKSAGSSVSSVVMKKVLLCISGVWISWGSVLFSRYEYQIVVILHNC